jgi:hypothetical protein
MAARRRATPFWANKDHVATPSALSATITVPIGVIFTSSSGVKAIPQTYLDCPMRLSLSDDELSAVLMRDLLAARSFVLR